MKRLATHTQTHRAALHTHAHPPSLPHLVQPRTSADDLQVVVVAPLALEARHIDRLDVLLGLDRWLLVDDGVEPGDRRVGCCELRLERLERWRWRWRWRRGGGGLGLWRGGRVSRSWLDVA